jgi:competence protein ComEA
MTRIARIATTLMTIVLAASLVGTAQAQSTTRSQSTSRTQQQPPSAPVNINTATATELEALPGVGPAMAARIVEYRQKNGSFKKIEDLMNVKGIGEKSFLKLKPLVTVGAVKVEE